MDIFISWSGSKSRRVAEKLREWLPLVINATKPWLSSHDIENGSKWGDEIGAKLQQCNFGLICLTESNLHEDWILFEAGALSKNAGSSRTWTLLIGLQPSDVTMPLAQFQHTSSGKADVLRLLQAINAHLEGTSVPSEQLVKSFDKWWPELESVLSEKIEEANRVTVRPERELLEEILETVRAQSRTNAGIPSHYSAASGEADAPRSVKRCNFCKLGQIQSQDGRCARCGTPLRKGTVLGEVEDYLSKVKCLRELAKTLGIKNPSVEEEAGGMTISWRESPGLNLEFSIPNDQDLETLEDDVSFLIEQIRRNSDHIS